MTEVPIVYPSHVLSPRRYSFQESDRRFRRGDVDNRSAPDDIEASLRSNTADNDMTSTDRQSLPLEDILRGVASASSLRLGDREAILTTSALVDSPDILSIALAWTAGASNSPIISQLNMNSLQVNTTDAIDTERRTLQFVKVCAFANGANLIRLVFVDCKGSFVSFHLTDDLVPVDGSLRTVTKMDYIEKQSVLDEVSGSEIQSTMVTFVSSTMAVVALAPFIVSVDLESAVGAVWSETQCLEEMRSRLTSLSQIFHQAGDLLLGKLDVGVKDMPSTAALCVSTSAKATLDHIFVFTLHSDASIRKWKVRHRESLLPQEVTTISDPESTLPLPYLWSDARNSVALAARLYEQVYVLAIHIKTQGYEGPSKDVGGKENSHSDCHLRVIHGSLVLDSVPSYLKLSVPRKATGVVGMAFRPNSPRCTLGVVFLSAEDEQHRAGSLAVVYPPSNLSILSTKPINHKTFGNLDEDAACEQARIRSLQFVPDILSEVPATVSTLEQDLHRLDALYMKFLFRPIYPRGTGTVLPPSTSCIRRALSKLVPALRRNSRKSIELETIKAVYEWRNKENRNRYSSTTVSDIDRIAPGSVELFREEPSNVSVYESYINEENREDIELDTVKSEDSDALEEERVSQVTAHENRWRRLLLQVWEEEQVFRHPLQVVWLNGALKQVMIRAGVTTLAEDANDSYTKGNSDPLSVLEVASSNLLCRIENDKTKFAELFRIEQAVIYVMTKSVLNAPAFENQNSSIVQDIKQIGEWAWKEEEDLKPQHGAVIDAITELSLSALLQWLQTTTHFANSHVSGVVPSSEVAPSDRTSEVDWDRSRGLYCQIRHAACNVCVRSIDTIRRIRLARCLLLSNMAEAGHARNSAFRLYIHAVSTLWAAAQWVPMPSIAWKPRSKPNPPISSPDSHSPPMKRLSFGDESSSILAPRCTSMTTCLDVLAITLLHSSDSLPNSSSVLFESVLLSTELFRTVFSSEKKGSLPELGILPAPTDASVMTEYPRLALRLVSPFVASPLPDDSCTLVAMRNETLAECLLVESNVLFSDLDLQIKMRQRACALLLPSESSDRIPIDHQSIRKAFYALNSFKVVPFAFGEDQMASLCDTVQRIIYGEDVNGVSHEIRHLCELETIQSMFAPLVWGRGADMDGLTKASVNVFATNMLDLSRQIRMLHILDRYLRNPGRLHRERPNQTTTLMFEQIEGAIEAIRTKFPSDVCDAMPEYVNLWSRLFDHALGVGLWEQAYKSSVGNPVAERRDGNLKRLVRTMVDSGALQELLEKCTFISASSSTQDEVSNMNFVQECVDLYEISSEILAETISQDVYTIRAASPDPLGLSDYQGALYALHASQEHWRRAAQAMDQRFFNATRALEKGSTSLSLNPGIAILRDGLIVEDLVLSAVSSMNALRLVTDCSHRFLVTSELGPFHSIQIDNIQEPRHEESRVKRTRGFNEKDQGIPGSTVDRISRFVTLLELEGRSLRSIALRGLFLDNSALAKSALSREESASYEEIDELLKRGYYEHGLLLAKSMAINYEAVSGSGKPEGDDFFDALLRYMLHTYLIPLATKLTAANAAYGALHRPSLRQLHASLDSLTENQLTPPFVSTTRSGSLVQLHSAAVSAASLEMVRTLTFVNSTEATTFPIALAHFFLDLDSDYPSLPAWFEELLAQPPGNKLISERTGSQAFLGNPAALVSLYARRGMLREACAMVISLLYCGKEVQKTDFRLPEDGNIEYIPYKKIDELWNLIELALQNKSASESELAALKDCQRQLDAALEQHFSMIKIREMGLRSARVLRQT